MARLAAGALCDGSAGAVALRDALPSLLRALEDPSPGVRDAAVAALQSAHRELGLELRRALEAARVRPGQLREIVGDSPQFVADAPPPGALAPAASAPPVLPTQPLSPSGVAKPTRAVGGTLRTAPSARDAAAQAADAPRPLATAIGDDGLVHPTPLRCGSERELAAEVEALNASLAPSQEWDVRMGALARLEGLVMGGAARMDGFQAALRALRDVLLAQMADRRSSVVKQACHLAVVLAAALGPEFEPHADALLPAIFGVVIISVKVMSDAGVACVRGVLRNCVSPKLAARCAEAARGDRNAKLRSAAFEWLSLALEEWGADADTGLERHAAALEDALRAGVADADSEARAGARRAAAAYARRWPDAFARLCARAEGAAGKRLRAAVEDGADGVGGDGAPRAAATRAPRLSASSTVSAAVAAARAAARARANSAGASVDVEVVTVLAPQRSAAASALPARPNSSSGARVSSSHHHVAVVGPASAAAALRSSVSDVSAYAIPADAAVPMLAAPPLGARRNTAALPPSGQHHGSGVPPAPRLSRSQTVPLGAHAGAASPPPLGSEPSEASARVVAATAEGPPLSVHAAVALLPRAGASPAAASWSTRAAAFASLRRALDEGGEGAGADADALAERIAGPLADALEDTHQRVAQAALEALAALACAAPAAAEAHLDRLLPGCFARLVDVNQSLRAAASAALGALGDALPPEALLPPLSRALDRSAQPRARTGVLEFALHAIVGGADDGDHDGAEAGSGGGGAEGGAAASPGAHGGAVSAPGEAAEATPAPAPRAAAAPGPALRSWVAKVAPLTADKHPGLRNAAVANLVAVYERCDAATVVAVLAVQPPAELAALRKALSPYLPDLDDALAARGVALVHAGSGGISNGVPRLSRSSSSNGAHMSPGTPPGERVAPAGSADGGGGSGGGGSAERPMPRRSSSLPLHNRPPSRPSSAGNAPTATPNDDAACVARVLAAFGSTPAGAGDDPAAAAAAAAPPSPRRRARALADVRRLAASAPRALWADFFAQLLVAMLEGLADVEASVREGALLALRDVASHQPALCGEYLSLVAPRAMSAARDASPAVAAAAEGALDAIFAKVEPGRCLEALRPLLPPPGAPAAAVTPDAVLPIRCLSAAVQRVSPVALAAALPELLPPLFAAFNADAADVRKAVVFCLVDIYLAIGEPLMPLLAPLTSAQAKLLQIYIQRAKQGAPAAAKPPRAT
jgi:CLIP-associating protein 1/2